MKRNYFKAFFIILLFAEAGICIGQSSSSYEARRAEAILTQGLQDKNPVKRKEAVIALSLEGATDTVFSLFSLALYDDDVKVRIAACAGLGSLKDKRSIPLLKHALKDDVPEVGFAAAQALWDMDDQEGKEALMEVLAGDRKSGSGYISSQRRDTIRMVKNPADLFKFMARTGIGFVPIPGLGTGISSIESLLKDPNLSGRALAAILLARDTDPDTLELLRQSLSDKDWSVRAAAVHAIALRNQPELRKDLLPLFDDKKDQVRYRAAAAYLRLELLEKERVVQPRRTRKNGR